MGITFFKILDSVLSQGISDYCKSKRISETEAIEKVREFLKENSTSYYSDNPKIEYNNPLCRIAYLYAYVGAHANLIDNSFFKFDDLRNLIVEKLNKHDTLCVCSLGGGPGSELLGFVKYIERTRTPDDFVDINFSLIDFVREWDESWNALIHGLEETFKDAYGKNRREWPIVVHRSFLPLDLTKKSDFDQFVCRFNDVQIFILNHTVSELISKFDEFKEVFNILVERAAEGSHFLIIDRKQSKVKALGESLLTNKKLSTLNFLEEQSNMDLDEQKTDLGKWFLLMQRNPKLSWNVFYLLSKKYN